MKKNIFISIIIITTVAFLFGSVKIHAQSNARIENINFDAEGSKLVITYDILKAKAGETFEIWVKIITESGKEIIPVSMIGDINKGVSGGLNKRIVWDVESDNAFIEEEFSVEVFARSEFEKETPIPKETQVKKKGKGISVGGALALSALLPGLGNRIVKGSGAQWLLGIAGYGFLAGSIAMNNSAYNAYEDYKIATTPEERDDLYKQAQDNEMISKVFFGTAVAIWVSDLIWTGFQAGKARKQNKPDISLIYSYDPYSKKPLVGLSYRF